MITIIFGSTPLLTTLQVLLFILSLGPEKRYQRILELIRVFRGGEPSNAKRRRDHVGVPRCLSHVRRRPREGE